MALFNTSIEKRAREAALSRPENEIVFRKRPDRIGLYLKKHLDKFVFDEFSPEYIKRVSGESKLGSIDFMKGVPIPLRKEDIKEFNSPNGLSVLVLAENMVWVIGIDPKFKYADQYIEFMKLNFGKKIDTYLSKEGKDAGELENYDDACIHFRASLVVHPDYLDSMYGYARCCKKMYENSNDEEYIGKFKAEAFDYFEMTTEVFPRFSQAYYYLGYMYLNMGLYAKAKVVWEIFLKKSHNNQDKKEIRDRIKQIKEPVMIEQGYNHVLAQRWEAGIQILEPYLNSKYKDWWPLSYYLGVAYVSTGRKDDAVKRFMEVMKLNPTHVETMYEMAAIYKAEGDKEKAKKYTEKAALLEKGGYGNSRSSGSDDEGLTESIIEDDKLPEPDKKKVKKLKSLKK